MRDRIDVMRTKLDDERAGFPFAIAGVLESAGGTVLRYGLTAILLYFGAFKFTAVEAEGIRPLIQNSPFMGWLYAVMSVQAVSNLIGITEIVIALMIAARRFHSRISGLGSLLGIGMFLTTVSFMFSTPGIWERVPGFPLPVPNAIGGFLIKDVFLLAAATWSAGEALGESSGVKER